MKIGNKPMTNNKYGSSASVAVFENAARARKFKFELQAKASKTQCYMTLLLAAVMIVAFVGNIIYRILA